MKTKKVVVVGAGPAGMICAIRSAELGAQVTLVEKNDILGKKLLLSGKGRCNLTNTAELNQFLTRFSKNGAFLRDAFKKLFNKELMEFFERRGLRLKVERQDRVFPVTDKSSSIVEVLEKELWKNKVNVLVNSQVAGLDILGGKIAGLFLKDGQKITADKVILATGGISYPVTGSTGDGFEIARGAGHTIIPLRPGLVPLEIKEKYPFRLEGLVLRNIRLDFSDGSKHVASEIGELLFTDFGISGPLVLSLSGKIADWLGQGKNISVEIDLKPALSKEQLDLRLLREFAASPKKTVKNALKELLPLRLIDVFLEIAKIKHDLRVSALSKKERLIIIDLLKGLRFNIKGTRPIRYAMVTRGGVSLREINPRTMESRVVPGLYFAGEIIDIDADTGGFNLQAAFSTGYLAGESAAGA